MDALAKKERGLFRGFLPALQKVRRAQGRLEQRIALLRHVEAIRMYAAAHEGKVPPKLSDVDVPLPLDPFTGKPFRYEVIDGVAHYECAALLLMLGERHPEAALTPAVGESSRGTYLQWMLHLANTLQPAFRAWFYPHEPADQENAEAAQASARARIETGLARLDAYLADREFIVGDHFTTVDLLATILCRWSRNMPRPATGWPNLKRYLDRIRQRPALREVHAREGLTDWIDG
jgi:glutathione S-transferase